MKHVSWIQWFGGLIVVAVACGTDRDGGGGSETHWMDPCSRDADCGQGLSCQCGVCTLPCEDEGDCNGLGLDSSCADWESIPSCANAPTSSGLCVTAAGAGGAGATGGASTTGGAGGEPSTAAGSGGDASGGLASGGSPCRPDPGGVAGSSFVADLPPPAGEACPSELDGFELCSWNTNFSGIEGFKILSQCLDGKWARLEEPSECATSVTPRTSSCNRPWVTDGMCCDDALYCEGPKICDGERWSIGPFAAGGAGGESSGTGGAPGGASPPAGIDGGGHVFFNIPRISLEPPVLCSDSEPCPLSGKCFELTDEFGLCALAQPEAATACTPENLLAPGEADECGCDGLTCGAGQTCISIEQTCSCAAGRHNACVASACASPNDCPDGTVCTPSSYLFDADARCLTPTCTRDADCNADAPGRCALLLEPPLQGGETYLSGLVCVYPGAPSDPGSCDGALQAWPDGHTCPE